MTRRSRDIIEITSLYTLFIRWWGTRTHIYVSRNFAKLQLCWLSLALIWLLNSPPVHPSTRPPRPPGESIKTAFYSKATLVKLVLLVEQTLFGRLPQFFSQIEEDLNIFQMEDDLSFVFKLMTISFFPFQWKTSTWPNIIFWKWKTASIFLEWKTNSIFLIGRQP